MLRRKNSHNTKKSLGQNFLVDRRVLQSIMTTADIQPSNTVLEVGAGLGVLTQALAERAYRVTSVEIDKQLIPILKESLGKFNNIELICGDGLKLNLQDFPPSSLFVANLPYNIATAMILKVLESGRFKRLVCLVQKEVAQKLCAKPSEKAFGSLSLIVQHFAEASIVRHVKPTSFSPQPKVNSSIILLNTISEVKTEEILFDTIYMAFKHRRKTLKRNLLMAGYESELILEIMGQVGLSEMVRAENLNLEQFKKLAKLLSTQARLSLNHY